MEKDLVEDLRQIYTAKQEIKAKYQGKKTVFISDMKGSTQLFTTLGDIEAAVIIQEYRDNCLKVINYYQGSGLPIGGDGLLAFFDRAEDAVNAAVKIQQRLQKEKISIRIGLDTGEVLLDPSMQSLTIIIASRIMNLADGGQILISNKIYQEIQGIDLAKFYAHDEYHIKGIEEPIAIYEVLWAKEQQPKKPIIYVEPQLELTPVLNILLLVSRPLISYFDLFGEPISQSTPSVSKVTPLSYKERENFIDSFKCLFRINLNPLPHATLDRLQLTLLKQQYDIIHFDGHGLKDGSLCFETEIGELHSITPKQLSKLFESKGIKMLVLSTCKSRQGIEPLKNIGIQCIVSMIESISEEAAAKFTLFFYTALNQEYTISSAFKEAKKNIALSFGKISQEEEIFDIWAKNEEIKNLTLKELKK